MGARLKQLFDLAVDTGGVAMPVKLAVKTSITTRMAETLEDTPERVAMVQRALDEILAVHAAAASRPAPVARHSPGLYPGSGGRIKRYFDFAKEQGGVK